MGFITSSSLAQSNYPAFLVEASRVTLRQEPSDAGNRLAVLKLGDIAVAEEDVLETWPWVLIPAGSRARDVMDADVIVDLEEDAWLRVAKRADEQRDLATRCPEGSAAVHLCICRCQHWRVVFEQVIAREEPSDIAKPAFKLVKGDLLCTGPSSSSSSSSGAPVARDKRWAYFGPGSVVWTHASGLNNAPKALLPERLPAVSIMKEHAEYGKLLQVVKQRQADSVGEKGAIVCNKGHCLQRFISEAGFPCDLCGEESPTGGLMWGCHRQRGRKSSSCSFDICDLCRHDRSRAKAWQAKVAGKAVEGATAVEPEPPVKAERAGGSSSSTQGPGAPAGGQKPEAEQEEASPWSKWLKFHKVHGRARHHSGSDLPLDQVNEVAVRRLLAESPLGEEKLEKGNDADAARVWLVTADQSLGVRTQDDPSSELLMDLEASDAVVCAHGPCTPMMTSNGHVTAGTWLCLRSGDKILHQGEVVATVMEKPVFIQVCLEDGSEQLRPWDLDSKVCIQALSGFGTPWAVRHKSVPVRNEPSIAALPLGLACRSDIVGVHAERGEWVQLSVSTDSRSKEGGHARPTFDLRSHAIGTHHDQKASLWMLTEHKTIGTLLTRLPDEEPCSLSTEGLLLSCARRGIYRRVSEICHRRIWKDNLEDLWEGEVEKLPPVETIEAKLFRPNVEVLHARKGGEFKGGAILEQFHIDVQQEKEKPAWVGVHSLPVEQKKKPKAAGKAAPHRTLRPHANVAPGQSAQVSPGSWANGQDKMEMPDDLGAADKVETWEIRRAVARVGYVHYFATEPRSRVGKAIWDQICRLAAEKNFLLVACHSILRQGTVDFWRSVGMKRVDPEAEQDRQLFKSQVNVRSQGSLSLEVDDLVQALPKSALPLFIWENSAALEAWSVSAERDEVDSEEEDEAKVAMDKKLRRELLRMRQHLKAR